MFLFQNAALTVPVTLCCNLFGGPLFRSRWSELNGADAAATRWSCWKQGTQTRLFDIPLLTNVSVRQTHWKRLYKLPLPFSIRKSELKEGEICLRNVRYCC